MVIYLSNEEVLKSYVYRGSGHIPKILRRKKIRSKEDFMMGLSEKQECLDQCSLQ